jgi:hypothetical protein
MIQTRQVRFVAALIGGWCFGLTASAADATAPTPVVPFRHASVSTMDKRIEPVQGDRTKPGQPFVLRIHAEAGYIIMPHTHPVDENMVVLEGSWALGMGDRFDAKALQPMEVGDFGFAAQGMKHFALSKTATVLQVHGIGPFFVYWVNPVYELTDHGVLLKKMADDPGQPVTDVPKDCFTLKLGARVHGPGGEGVVIGAQCTPQELTQYRIKVADGKNFWAQTRELQAL